jgi:hypothetical protein
LLAAVAMGSVAAGFLVVAAVHYSDLLLADAAKILSEFINPYTYHLILTLSKYPHKINLNI